MGLNVALSTDDPLQFHKLSEPLLEEYTAAEQQWDLSGTDIAEIMRNSVLQSGFTHADKMKYISEHYQWSGVAGNDPTKTDIPDCRAALRHESLLEEYYWVYKKNKLHADHEEKDGEPAQDRHATHHTVLVPKDTRWKWKPKSLTNTKEAGHEVWPTTWLELVDGNKLQGGRRRLSPEAYSSPVLTEEAMTTHRRLTQEARARCLAARRRDLKHDIQAFVTQVNGVDMNAATPSLRVLHHRSLADAASMAAKNVDAMSPDELTLHRRRMTCGSRALAALMEKIEEQQRNDRLCR